MTKISDLRKGDIVRLANGHEVWVEYVGIDIPFEHVDVAQVYDASIDQEGILKDTDEWERVVPYVKEE